MADLLRTRALASGMNSPIELVSKSPEWRKWLGDNLSPSQSTELIDSWAFKARHNQLPPTGPFRIWAVISGRAFGKNRIASEWMHDQAEKLPGLAGFLAGRTLGAVGKTVIGHPKSGLLVTQRASNPCEYKPHLRRLTWANGFYCDVHSSEEPDDARGPEYAVGFADEIGTWKRSVDFAGNTTWDNLQFGLRGGTNPQMIAATTPRPTALVRDLIERGKTGIGVHLTTGTLYDNRANLPDSYIEEIERKYKGTRLYRQEALGELLLDVENAIITAEMLDAARVDTAPEMDRVVIGVDPAAKSGKKSDKTGINASGIGVDGHLYALANRSCKLSPDGWARRAVETFYEFDASLMCCEDNQGGEMVESIIRGIDPTINVQRRTATKSKKKRAEPILAFYERGEAHIVGEQRDLEDQLVQFTPGGYVGDSSPDDADAHVWAAHDLMLQGGASWDDVAAANA